MYASEKSNLSKQITKEVSPTYLSTSKLLLMFIFGELALWDEGEEIWLYILDINSTRVLIALKIGENSKGIRKMRELV